MVRVALSTASLHLEEALGHPWYELESDGRSVVKAVHPFISAEAEIAPPTLELLEVPAEIAAHGLNTLDLCIQHIPSIDDSYLEELRFALKEAKVELFQLLIDLGDVTSPDSDERSAGIRITKRWMEIASELGAAGVRYVPGDSEPSPETIRLSAEAFRQLADYAVECGLKPATENYKTMTNKADDLLRILDLSDREYGVIADFGNARGPDKFDTLARLVPHATSIHAWGECEDDGTLNADDFRQCLNMVRDSGFAGPIMFLGAHPNEMYKRTRDLWGGIDELRQEVWAVFGENLQG